MRIGFDLDGVLFNFGDSVRRYLEATDRGHIWKSGPTPEPYWNFYEDWGWDFAQFKQLCNEGADAGYIFAGPARKHAAFAVQLVKGLGHEVVIITDRGFGKTPEVSQELTKAWLSQHKIPYDELHFSADKTVAHTDMFVEDKVENFQALEAAGVETYLVNRSWNQHLQTNKRIKSVLDYAYIVGEKSVYDIGSITKNRTGALLAGPAA